MVRVFDNGNGWGDLGSSDTKDSKMVLDTSLLNHQNYKVWIKSKMEQSRERSSALPYTLVSLLLKREPSSRPRLRSPTLQHLRTKIEEKYAKIKFDSHQNKIFIYKNNNNLKSKCEKSCHQIKKKIRVRIIYAEWCLLSDKSCCTLLIEVCLTAHCYQVTEVADG